MDEATSSRDRVSPAIFFHLNRNTAFSSLPAEGKRHCSPCSSTSAGAARCRCFLLYRRWAGGGGASGSDPLPSWNDGAAKKTIIDFVTRVTTHGGADFVPLDQRIATFDNDGTLWAEQPIYFQFAFAIDRVKALAPKHPEWKNEAAVQGRCSRTT